MAWKEIRNEKRIEFKKHNNWKVTNKARRTDDDNNGKGKQIVSIVNKGYKESSFKTLSSGKAVPSFLKITFQALVINAYQNPSQVPKTCPSELTLKYIRFSQ